MHWGFRVIHHQLGPGICLRTRSKVLTPDFGSGVSRIPLNRSSVEFPFVMAVDEDWEGYHRAGMELRFWKSSGNVFPGLQSIQNDLDDIILKRHTKLDNCDRFAPTHPAARSYSLIIAQI
jgi:hypothetical protein